MIAAIGANALLLLYVWLASAIIASFLSNKKGYGEKPGLASGLLLSAVAIVVWLLVPAKANSDWGRRKAHKAAGAAANPDVPAKPGPAD